MTGDVARASRDSDVRRPWIGYTAAPRSVPERPRGVVRTTEGSPRELPRIRVLIADDDNTICETLVRVLRKFQGLSVIGVAKDADEAIRIAALRRPDVALLDVRMPCGGGQRAAREIRWRSPRTTIIALSAHVDRRTVEDMLASGATNYLAKDSSVEDIVMAVTCSVGEDPRPLGHRGNVVSELRGRRQKRPGSRKER